MIRTSMAAMLVLCIACGAPPGGPGTDPKGPGDDPNNGTTPPDTTPPTVIATFPANGAVNVHRDTPVVLEFSKKMDRLSFKITTSPGPLSYRHTTSENDSIVTYEYSSRLTAGTRYQVTVEGKDAAGNALRYTFSFDTAAAVADQQAPTVVARAPAQNATNVASDAPIWLQFSETVDPTTFAIGFGDYPSGRAGELQWSPNFDTVNIGSPEGGLLPNNNYNLEFFVEDAAGNPLASFQSPTKFKTASTIPVGPRVRVASPGASQTGVPTNARITFSFSAAMDQTATRAALTISPSVTCAFSGNAAQLICTPSTALLPSTVYTVTLGTGAKDSSGNALAAPYSFTFTTAAGPDTTAPSLVSVSPSDNAVGVHRRVRFVVTFNEPVDPITAEAALQVFESKAGYFGDRSWNVALSEMTHTGWREAADGQYMYWTLANTVTDLAGNAIGSASSGGFRIMRLETARQAAIGAISRSDGLVYRRPYGYWFGDDEANRDTVTVLQASLVLPETTAQIVRATLELRPRGCVGGAPSGPGGTPIIEGIWLGKSSVWSSPPWAAETAPIPLNGLCLTPALPRVTVPVTAKVRADWAARATRGLHTDFQIRFPARTNGDGISDRIFFHGESHLRPELVIQYEIP